MRKKIDMPYGLLPYDFQGVLAYREKHPEEPFSSSGEWLRVDEVKAAIVSLVSQAVDIAFSDVGNE